MTGSVRFYNFLGEEELPLPGILTIKTTGADPADKEIIYVSGDVGTPGCQNQKSFNYQYLSQNCR